MLKTYPLNEECSRCEDCGRNVHDYHVDDELWESIIGNPASIYCYDCFVNRAREQGNYRISAVVYEGWERDMKNKWIKISDKLPPINEDVWLFDEDQGVVTGEYWYDDNHNTHHYFSIGDEWFGSTSYYKVTHWQPILVPKPPTGSIIDVK